MPSPFRQQLWASVPPGPVARVAVFQALAGALVFRQTEPGAMNRYAVVGVSVLGIVTVPLGRFVASLSRDHPRTYYWSGRAWAVALPATFTLSVADAYDGTGVVFSDNMMTPFMLPCAVGVSFAIGAQGALLGVPTELMLHVSGIMVAICVLKLHATYTHAYALLHAAFLGGLALGYACVSKYADLHEQLRDAAEELMRTAVAITQPYLIADDKLRVLAVNQRFTDVLGYESDEIYGKHVSTLLDDTSLDAAWVETALASGQSEHVWTVVCKNRTTLPVRIKLGAQRCPINATNFYCAKLASMYLEQRAMQLEGEKERLQWDLASQHEGEGDPREALGARATEGVRHRTLGAMQDQATTDAAVSCAQSFDHVDSVASPTVPGHALIAPARPKTPSSIESLQSSSVMDTISQAAKKSPTRAPPPPKPESGLPRPKKVCSEPSAAPKHKTGNRKPKRVVPGIERDPRECS